MPLDDLPDGAVVFAERRMNKAGETVDRGPDQYEDEAGWAWHLHTAVLLAAYDPGAPWLDGAVPTEGVELGEPALLHSTGFRETVVVWGVREFMAYYLPVAAKVVTRAPREPGRSASSGPGTPGRPRAATTFDTMAIHQLREDLAEWMLTSGIEQWERGEIKPWRIADQIEDGEWWVVDGSDGDQVIAAVRGGATALRLDCVEGNVRLNDYYRAHGYREIGRRDLPAPWHPVVLWERRL